MNDQDPSFNPGSDATTNNLAGTRDEFNDEVTARLTEEAKSEKRGEEAKSEESREEREEQPALTEDDDSPASDAEASS
ncbi:hypothetical protein OL239_01600 [Arthrobacter sp. ATA002]|uniref:hypothetical protein n=1 Tax=Arthrobacter sp. ATA002 TaxID=2991715 RepID=UPI0022A697A0|nr:hypothetical protein [Arthrobacter sp. ATA002]WAP52047.1 hypothetical protein OL239_01600 [Arthrobacter sp. ATA002]